MHLATPQEKPEKLDGQNNKVNVDTSASSGESKDTDEGYLFVFDDFWLTIPESEEPEGQLASPAPPTTFTSLQAAPPLKTAISRSDARLESEDGSKELLF